MFPHTRSLLELIRDEQAAQNEPHEYQALQEKASHGSSYDPKILQLKMKRRHQLGLLKKMMEDAGYGDLARMTTISKSDYDLD